MYQGLESMLLLEEEDRDVQLESTAGRDHGNRISEATREHYAFFICLYLQCPTLLDWVARHLYLYD